MKKSSRIIYRMGISLAAFALCGLTAILAHATPSTQIWIPSTDIQAYKTVHLNFDTYIRDRSNADGSRTAPVVVIGPTVGILPFPKIQAEIGFDLISAGGDADKHPLYGHVKTRHPGGFPVQLSPAVAVGMYNIGTKSGDARNGELATNQDIAYALVAKTIPVIGRFVRRVLRRKQEVPCWTRTETPTRRASCFPGTGR